MDNKRFIKKTGLYFIGNLSTKLLAFILVPIYAIYLKPENLGKYDYILTIQGILIPIVLLAIWEAVLKFLISENDKSNRNSIINASALFTIMQMFLLSLILLIYSKVNNTQDIIYTILILVIYGFANMWQYFSRALGENKTYIIASIVSTIVNLLSNIVLICFFKLEHYGLYISYIVSNLLNIVIIEIKINIFKNINIKEIDFKVLKKLIKFSMPLIINLISIWLLSGFAKIIITNQLGENANGLYAFANKFSSIISLFGSIIGMAFIEEAIISSKENKMDTSISKVIENVFNLMICIGILMLPVINIFYNIIHNTEYIESQIYVPLLILYSIFMTMSTMVGAIYQAIDKTKYISITTIIGALVSVVISLSFINIYGIKAVVVSQIIGAIIMLISRYILAKKFVDIKVKFKNIIFTLIIYNVISIISIKSSIFINIILELFVLVILILLNKNLIEMLINKLKKRKIQNG